MKAQPQTVNDVCLRDIASFVNIVKSEIIANLDFYSPFFVAGRNLENYLHRYMVDGIFDQSIADVSVAALCNSIGVKLLIYEVKKDGGIIETILPPGRVSTQHTVKLLRSGGPAGSSGRCVSLEHYDALLPLKSTTNFTAATKTSRTGKSKPATTIPDMFRNHKRRKLPDGLDGHTTPLNETDADGIQTVVGSSGPDFV